MTEDDLIQLGLGLFSLSSIYMSVLSKNLILNKYAPLVGLLAQPFWIIQAITSDQVGALVVSSVITMVYLKAIYNNFVKV